MYTVYLLRCADNSLYCGQTKNLEKRLGEHRERSSKSAKYTRAKGVLELVYAEKAQTLSDALKREAQIKKLTKNAKEYLISAKLS